MRSPRPPRSSNVPRRRCHCRLARHQWSEGLSGADGAGPAVPGNTVLVSTDAGSLGSLVRQIARNLDSTAIGLTGDAAKVSACQVPYCYVAAHNYKTTDWAAAVACEAPRGIDVYSDNVGVPILDAALRQMAVGGRIVQCGTASTPFWDPVRPGSRQPTSPRRRSACQFTRSWRSARCDWPRSLAPGRTSRLPRRHARDSKFACSTASGSLGHAASSRQVT